jgi:cell division protein FtsL
MGAVARRIQADPFAHRSSHLRLVTTPPAVEPARSRKTTPGTRGTKRVAPKRVTSGKLSSATRASIRREEATARAAFWAFVGVLVFAVVLGGARVTLVVRAAEATVTQSRMQASMKAQRAEADALEVDKSTLSTPSRIAGIASTTMDMGEPVSVRYISLPSGTAADSNGTAATAPSRPSSALDGLLGAVVDLSAGEAQSLLVGDLGLAGSR